MSERDRFNLPQSCFIGKQIYKKQFYDNADMSTADKKLFAEGVEKITWFYSLRPDTINLKTYADETREYKEIEIIEAQLTADKGAARIAEIILRAIPYPMLLMLKCEGKTACFAAHQHTNPNDVSQNTLEDIIKTPWLEDAKEIEARLDFKKLSFKNCLALYTDIVDTISIYNAQKLLGDERKLTGAEARELTEKVEEINGRIAVLKEELKKETQFNRRMEINVAIKDNELLVTKLEEFKHNAK